MEKYSVAEIFSSVNGEGPRSGQLACFVRMQGCNLDCSFCDTGWARKENANARQMSTAEILDAVRQSGIRNVTLTGGEPLLQDNIEELLNALAKEEGIRVEIETNGSIPLAPFAKSRNAPSFTMDYKLPGSGMEERMLVENFEVLSAKDTVKFVVRDRTDLIRSRELIETYGLRDRCRVFLSPVYGEIEPEEIADFIKEFRMNDVTLQLQIHKIIWDSDKNGV